MKNQTEARPYCSYFRISEKYGTGNPRGMPPVRRGGPEPELYWNMCLPRAIKKKKGDQKIKLNQVELKPQCWDPTCLSSFSTSVQVSLTCNCGHLECSSCYNPLCLHARQARVVENLYIFSPPSPSND